MAIPGCRVRPRMQTQVRFATTTALGERCCMHVSSHVVPDSALWAMASHPLHFQGIYVGSCVLMPHSIAQQPICWEITYW
jgi:hypothetical protein